MILRRLRVRRFLGFVDDTFEFAPGINVVVGPNESGKSSLRTAIRAALFGNPSTTAALDVYRTWGTDQLPVLELEFDVDGRRYRLVKDFQNRRPILTGGGEEALDQYKHITERIADYLGLSTAKIFQITAEVAQAELERVQLTNVSTELSRVLGGGADVEEAVRLLTAHVKDMDKGQKTLARDPGELKRLEDHVQALTAQQQKVAADIAQIERTQRELAELQPSLAELDAALAAKQTLLKVNQDAQDLRSRLDAARREETMLSQTVTKLDQTRQQLVQIGRDLEAMTAPGVPDEALIRDALLADAQITQVEQAIAALSEEPTAEPERPRAGWVAWTATGVAAAVAGFVTALLGSTTLGVGLAIVGAVSLIIGMVGMRGHRRALAAVMSRGMDRDSRRRALNEQLQAARREHEARLAQLGGESLADAERRLRRYREMVRDREEAVRVQDILLAGTSEETLRERLDRLRTDIYGLTKELESPARAAVELPAFETQKLRDEVDSLTKKTADLAERVKRVTWEVEHRRDQAEDQAAVEEQLQEATEALEAARHRRKVYEAALDGLLEARRQIERPVRDVVAGKAGDYLRILSGGRYDRIEVEKDSLQVWVWSADAGARVEPKEPALSRGTIDLVYLSLRFALVTALAEGRHPPLLLDDPFITFDDSRRASAAELLKELSKTHQVFLFTCEDAFDTAAGAVIALPGRMPSGGPADAGPPADRTPAEVPAVGPLWEHSPH